MLKGMMVVLFEIATRGEKAADDREERERRLTVERQIERTLADYKKREGIMVLLPVRTQLPVILFMFVRMQDGGCVSEREERDVSWMSVTCVLGETSYSCFSKNEVRPQF